MLIILSVFFILFVLIYIDRFFRFKKNLLELNDIIREFNSVFDKLETANPHRNSRWAAFEDYTAVRELISLMPRISKFLTNTQPLRYDSPDEVNLGYAEHIYSQLFHSKDILINLEPKSKNPTYALLDTFLIPSKLLGFFGINLNAIPGRIFSLLTWIVVNYRREFLEFVARIVTYLID